MAPHSDMTRLRVYRALDTGVSVSEAARKFNVSRKSIYEWIDKRKNESGKKLSPRMERIARWNDTLPPPLLPNELSKEALRALEDFRYWRLRYLGRRSTPWQVEAANRVVEWINSPQTELCVINCPPGAGKSTLFTHDIPAWLICRDRTIRILLGHSVSRQAYSYITQLRRTLQRTRPLPADGRGREAAQGCLAEDYGRFKPPNEEAWRQTEFNVMMSIDEDNADESGLESKEPTVAAYGMESEYLGARANFVVWDDLVTGDVLRTKERIEEQQRKWDEEGETRLEPGGCLLLMGQRMGHEDLYNYCLSQTLGNSREPKYRHIIYPAHHEELCTGDHGPNLDHDPDDPTPVAKAWPDGCLLDPSRLPWYGRRGLLTIQTNNRSVYEVQYQQQDVAPGSVLVPKVWIDGGRGDDGVDYPGCWDNHREIATLPRGLAPPYYSIAAADPSASNYWAIGWWIYHPASEQIFLLDLHNERMDGPDFLDYNANDGVHYGIAQDWQERSRQLGAPITHWIIEANACQRWLLQFDHTKQWARQNRVLFVPHTTGINKLDPELGIQSIATKYKYGNIRLPGTEMARHLVRPIVTEATHYEPTRPKAHTDDTLMMTWFVLFHLAKLSRPKPTSRPRAPRPTWAAA